MKDLRKPPWLKKRIPSFQDISKVKTILSETDLHTVCEEARCPNLGECFSGGAATMLILGKICTRNCGFCAVEHGMPASPDEGESERVAQAVKKMSLHYVVITSVTRDDLSDGGASHFAKMILAIREMGREEMDCPVTGRPEIDRPVTDRKIRIEVLIPDLRGDPSSLRIVLEASPDVLNHNVETVSRLYPEVRPQADYRRSLDLLRRSKESHPHILTKSGFMLGLGESREEVFDLLRELREAECDFLTIGQYLQARPDRLPVVRYIPPEEFEDYRKAGEEMGFKAVAAGPFVRSSFHASRMFEGSVYAYRVIF